MPVVAALGAFVASSDSEMADVECFSSSDADAEPIDMPGCKYQLAAATLPVLTLLPVNTETYHAQYHVLEAFSFFNMILSEWQNSISAAADPDRLPPKFLRSSRYC